MKEQGNFPDQLEQYLDSLFRDFLDVQIVAIVVTGCTLYPLYHFGWIELSEEFSNRFYKMPFIALQLYLTKQCLLKYPALKYYLIAAITLIIQAEMFTDLF